MTQDALHTKWKFIVEFEDEETNEISGTIGQAGTREECEGLLEFEMQYHNSHGRRIQSGCDHVIGEAFICEEDNFGADNLTVR
jgi:hypothetical protein